MCLIMCACNRAPLMARPKNKRQCNISINSKFWHLQIRSLRVCKTKQNKKTNKQTKNKKNVGFKTSLSHRQHNPQLKKTSLHGMSLFNISLIYSSPSDFQWKNVAVMHSWAWINLKIISGGYPARHSFVIIATKTNLSCLSYICQICQILPLIPTRM